MPPPVRRKQRSLRPGPFLLLGTVLLAAAGCSSSPVSSRLSPAPSFVPLLSCAELLPAAEGDPAENPLPEPFDPVTTAGTGDIIAGDGADVFDTNSYARYSALEARAGGFLPVKLSDRYHDGFTNWDVGVLIRQYEDPLKAGGSIEKDEFIQKPGYFGMAVYTGKTGDNQLSRLEFSYAKSWRAQNLYFVADLGFAGLAAGMPSQSSQKIGCYYYIPGLPVRSGIVYEGRSADYSSWPTGRWDGLRIVGEYYGLNRTIFSASYALSLDDEGDTENQFFVEARYFPFDDYYFSFSDEYNVYPDDTWEYLLNLGIGYNHGNKWTVDFDFSARDASCATAMSFSATVRFTYRN
ncbi:MAG: hypothetical protein JW909_07355 [Planctomycetes bacterium]|nr:hypothetical protein [Planctomycetota bacterium]